jgi:sugar fermentation stimulation protein A
MLRRYQRFLADIELADGRMVTAHVPNTGSMATCWEPGAAVQISHSDNPRRKLSWTLERVATAGGWIGVNTARPNPVVAEAVAAGRIEALAGYRSLRREVPWRADAEHAGRLDLGLSEGPRPDALVEIKNVTLLAGDRLCFPDAVSARGRKHLGLLTAAVAAGLRGVMVFALNRPEGRCMAPAGDIDPAYAEALRAAAAAGVELLAVRLRHLPDGIVTGETVAVELE